MTLRENVQRSLDNRLLRLLAMIRASATFPAIAGVVDSILRDFTHPDDHRGLQRGEKLLSPSWKKTWDSSEQVTWWLFGDIEDKSNSDARSLHRLFTELVRLVRSSQSAVLKAKNTKRVDESLCEFLSLRDYEVNESNPNAQRGNTLRDDVERRLRQLAVENLASCLGSIAHSLSNSEAADFRSTGEGGDGFERGPSIAVAKFDEALNEIESGIKQATQLGRDGLFAAVREELLLIENELGPSGTASLVAEQINADEASRYVKKHFQQAYLKYGDSLARYRAKLQAASMDLGATVETIAETPPKGTAVENEEQVYERIRTYWDSLSDEKITEIENELRERIKKRRQFRDWFRGDTSDQEKRLTAAGMWSGFPTIAGGTFRQWQAAKTSERYQRIASYAETWIAIVKNDHEGAVRFLMREVENQGLSLGPLWEAGRISRELFANGGLAMRDGATSCGWPDCLGEARYQLPQAQQDAIRDGEAVFQMWLTKVSDQSDKGGLKANAAIAKTAPKGAEVETKPLEQDGSSDDDIDLDATGEAIVDAMGKKSLTDEIRRKYGEEIADLSRCKFNSHFKATLANLRRHRILLNPGRGYYLGPKGVKLYQARQKVRTKSG